MNSNLGKSSTTVIQYKINLRGYPSYTGSSRQVNYIDNYKLYFSSTVQSTELFTELAKQEHGTQLETFFTMMEEEFNKDYTSSKSELFASVFKNLTIVNNGSFYSRYTEFLDEAGLTGSYLGWSIILLAGDWYSNVVPGIHNMPQEYLLSYLENNKLLQSLSGSDYYELLATRTKPWDYLGVPASYLKLLLAPEVPNDM